jgi:hypothetical protein
MRVPAIKAAAEGVSPEEEEAVARLRSVPAIQPPGVPGAAKY